MDERRKLRKTITISTRDNWKCSKCGNFIIPGQKMVIITGGDFFHEACQPQTLEIEKTFNEADFIEGKFNNG